MHSISCSASCTQDSVASETKYAAAHYELPLVWLICSVTETSLQHLTAAHPTAECTQVSPCIREMPEQITQQVGLEEPSVSGLQLDGDGPILFQVGKLTPDEYHQWVYSPRLGAPRFFQSNLLESISKTSWWYVPVIWGTVAAMCLSHMHSHQTYSHITTSFMLLCGILLWQLTEYCIHRFLFHLEPSSYWGITLHFTFHGCHHKWPLDNLRLVFPPVPAAPIVAGVFYTLHQWLPKEVAMSVSTGMLLGYIAYDCTHYYLHHSSSHTGIFQGLKKAHMSHHYKNHDTSYGISSRLFDSLLCTPAIEG